MTEPGAGGDIGHGGHRIRDQRPLRVGIALPTVDGMTLAPTAKMKYRVEICQAVPQAILRIPREIRPDRLGRDIASGTRELVTVAQRAGLTVCGAPTLTYRQQPPPNETVMADFGVPVEHGTTLGPKSGAEVVVLPGAQVARTCHRGGYDTLGSAYLALREWLDDAGYRSVGPATEAYLIGPDEVSDAGQLLTEIRIPVVQPPMISVHLDAPIATAVQHTREALRQRGYDVLTEIDLGAVLRERLGVHLDGYIALDACHPSLIYRALQADPEAGALLPCTVVVRAVPGGTTVEVTDPMVLMQATARSALWPVARESRRLLGAVLDDVRSPAPAPR